MSEGGKEKEEVALLQSVYSGIRSQTELILNLMPHVRGEALKSNMTVLLCTYESFAARASKKLFLAGVTVNGEDVWDKLFEKWSTLKETMLDKSEEKIMGLLRAASAERAEAIKRELRAMEGNNTVSEETLRLVRELCVFEEKNAKGEKIVSS